MKTDLRVYDLDGEQDWLLGGPLEQDRLRSMETRLSWNRDGWNADLILEDAAKDGVVDWAANIPGRMNLSSSKPNIDWGLEKPSQRCWKNEKRILFNQTTKQNPS